MLRRMMVRLRCQGWMRNIIAKTNPRKHTEIQHRENSIELEITCNDQVVDRNFQSVLFQELNIWNANKVHMRVYIQARIAEQDRI